MIFEEKRDRLLPNECDPLQRKLNRERFLVNGLEKTRPKRPMNRNRGPDDALRDAPAPQIFSCFPAFLIHTVPAAPAFSQPGSWARETVGISVSAISSPGVYSGGNGGGSGFSARAANS